MAGRKKIGEGVGTVWVHGEKTSEPVAFAEGDEVPAWAAKQMGDHCFEDVQDEGDEAGDAGDDA